AGGGVRDRGAAGRRLPLPRLSSPSAVSFPSSHCYEREFRAGSVRFLLILGGLSRPSVNPSPLARANRNRGFTPASSKRPRASIRQWLPAGSQPTVRNPVVLIPVDIRLTH